MIQFWQKLKQELNSGHRAVFLYVLESSGSSPGRRGYKMFVSDSGLIFGSIGGGIMEHKLVELSKHKIKKGGFEPFIKRQIHRDDISENKSGMICSGEQTIAFYALDAQQISLISGIIDSITNASYGVLSAGNNLLTYEAGGKLTSQFESTAISLKSWMMRENFGYFPKLHIIGGGHTGLALSKFASALAFEVTIYDDRNNLSTLQRNVFAHHIKLVDYTKIGKHITEDSSQYVVLMSFGYKTDKIILKQLLHRSINYLGMMGSAEKVQRLFEELLKEGFDQNQLKKVHAPIGIQIGSKTPEEIAISILAEITKVKNNLNFNP